MQKKTLCLPNKLNFYKLYYNTKSPKFSTDGAACFDVRAYLDKPITVYEMDNRKITRYSERYNEEDGLQFAIYPADRVLVPTGLVFDIPEGHSVRLHTRSSLSWKKGLIMPNGEGIIDSDYYHETFVMLYNSSADEVRITHGERIAQGELVQNLTYEMAETTEIPTQTTNRVGGFGSTGTK